MPLDPAAGLDQRRRGGGPDGPEGALGQGLPQRRRAEGRRHLLLPPRRDGALIAEGAVTRELSFCGLLLDRHSFETKYSTRVSVEPPQAKHDETLSIETFAVSNPIGRARCLWAVRLP